MNSHLRQDFSIEKLGKRHVEASKAFDDTRLKFFQLGFQCLFMFKTFFFKGFHAFFIFFSGLIIRFMLLDTFFKKFNLFLIFTPLDLS